MTAPTRPNPSRRGTLEILDEASCWELLKTADFARLIHVRGRAPEVALVNVAVDGDTLVVRSTAGGRLAQALARPGAAVALQADDTDSPTRTGWSVVAHGTMTPVLDAVEAAGLDRLAPASWLLGDSGGTWLRFTIDRLSGRRLSATEDAP